MTGVRWVGAEWALRRAGWTTLGLSNPLVRWWLPWARDHVNIEQLQWWAARWSSSHSLTYLHGLNKNEYAKRRKQSRKLHLIFCYRIGGSRLDYTLECGWQHLSLQLNCYFHCYYDFFSRGWGEDLQSNHLIIFVLRGEAATDRFVSVSHCHPRVYLAVICLTKRNCHRSLSRAITIGHTKWAVWVPQNISIFSHYCTHLFII